MKKFQISVPVSASIELEIEAEDEGDAWEKWAKMEGIGTESDHMGAISATPDNVATLAVMEPDFDRAEIVEKVS